VCVYLFYIPEPVRYAIYTLALAFDLRYESGTYTIMRFNNGLVTFCFQPLAQAAVYMLLGIETCYCVIGEYLNTLIKNLKKTAKQ